MANTVSSRTPDLSGAAEAELLGLAQAGHGAAFREIMQRNNQRLYRVVRSVLRDDTEAEDALQETYLKAFTHLADFRGEAQLSTWLTRVALNEALGRRRKERATVTLDTIDRNPAPDTAEVISLFGDRSQTPEQDVGRSEIRRLLESAIDRLPVEFRSVFVLRATEGMSVEETAAALNLKPETVKTRLHRARRQLQREIENEFGAVLSDAFPFLGSRCARLTETVLERLGLER